MRLIQALWFLSRSRSSCQLGCCLYAWLRLAHERHTQVPAYIKKTWQMNSVLIRKQIQYMLNTSALSISENLVTWSQLAAREIGKCNSSLGEGKEGGTLCFALMEAGSITRKKGRIDTEGKLRVCHKKLKN